MVSTTPSSRSPPPNVCLSHAVMAVVVDVYVEEAKQRVWIMDFNPFGPVTDGQLFSWAEIFSAPTTRAEPQPPSSSSARTDEEGTRQRSVDFRIVDSEAEVRVSTASSSRYPVDVTRGMFDPATATDINKLVEMMQSGKFG